MLLKRTIAQLDVGYVPPDQAEQMGQLGYMQWLGALKGDANYIEEARKAHVLGSASKAASPAVAVFCDLLEQSIASALSPLDLKLPKHTRRGGASARRRAL